MRFTANYHQVLRGPDGHPIMVAVNSHMEGHEPRPQPQPQPAAQPRPQPINRARAPVTPLHPLSCRCPTCLTERTEARMRTRDWILSVQREARAREFEARCTWIEGILVDE